MLPKRRIFSVTGRAARVACLCFVLLASMILPSFAQDSSKKLLVAYAGIDFHAHQRVAGRRPGFLQKTWARRHLGFYRQRIGDLTGIARRRGQGRFHQRRPHGGRHRCRRRHGDFGWNDPYTSLSALGDAPDTPARGFERQESRHQHLRFRQPSGGRSGAAAARPGYGARQNRDLAGGNAAGASRGPGHRQNRGDAFGAGFWPGRARTRDSR